MGLGLSFSCEDRVARVVESWSLFSVVCFFLFDVFHVFFRCIVAGKCIALAFTPIVRMKAMRPGALEFSVFVLRIFFFSATPGCWAGVHFFCAVFVVFRPSSFFCALCVVLFSPPI